MALFALTAGGPRSLAQESQPEPESAPELTAEQEAAMKKLQGIIEGLTFLEGRQIVGDNLASVDLKPEFVMLNSAQAKIVLEQVWGNPPSSQAPLGMILPKGANLLDSQGYAVIMTYDDDDGHVKDEDASTTDFGDLLKTLKEQTSEASKVREKEGYGSVALVGWAAEPRYDAATKKLYWAKELEFDGNPDHTLNYNIRILGARGVLVLNAISSMASLKTIDEASPDILSMVDFLEGNRYADHRPGIDKVAAYGIGGLIAGKVLAKAGLFKVIGLFMVKFAKPLLVGAVALGAVLKRIFSKKTA